MGIYRIGTNEACNVFYESAGIIKQIKLPFSIYVMRVIWRNFIVFLHTIVIYIPVAIYFKVAPTPMMFLALPGLALVLLNLIWVTIVIGISATRYRDMVPMIVTIISLMMFCHTDHVDDRLGGKSGDGRQRQSCLPPDRDRPRAGAGHDGAAAVVGSGDLHGHRRLGPGVAAPGVARRGGSSIGCDAIAKIETTWPTSS